MERIPVAVIGCGHLGTYHARTYVKDPRCRLVAVVDVIQERARRLASEHGCQAFGSHESILDRVAAASVATPTTTHEQIATALLGRGIHTLVEKPLGVDPEGGARIVAAARGRGAVLAVGHIERCNPAFVMARRDLRAPRFIESHRLATFVPRSLDIDVILDLMIHDIDLVLSLAASPLEGVDAIGVPVLTPEADIANARLRFADGSVANLTASRVSQSRMRKIRFFERNLYISVDLANRRVEVARLLPEPAPGDQRGDGEGSPEERFLASRGLRLVREARDAAEEDALTVEIGAFLGACSGRGKPIVDGEAGLASLTVALQVRSAVSASIARLGIDTPQ